MSTKNKYKKEGVNLNDNQKALYDLEIYIPIPFNSLFGNINMNGLYYSTVKFIIQDYYELSNYAQSFSLISKVFLV
jgi:hypothetical protein